jgi:hypothetical protein
MHLDTHFFGIRIFGLWLCETPQFFSINPYLAYKTYFWCDIKQWHVFNSLNHAPNPFKHMSEISKLIFYLPTFNLLFHNVNAFEFLTLSFVQIVSLIKGSHLIQSPKNLFASLCSQWSFFINLVAQKHFWFIMFTMAIPHDDKWPLRM